MGLFNKIKEVFGGKKEESIFKTSPETEEKLSHVKEGRRFLEKTCPVCKQTIGQERFTYQAGNYFHKKCYKQALKMAMSGAK
jgi:phage FluMu protein Com